MCRGGVTGEEEMLLRSGCVACDSVDFAPERVLVSSLPPHSLSLVVCR